MQSTANLMSLADRITAHLSPQDAVQFSSSCRDAAEGASAFREALAFALTRPEALQSETTCDYKHFIKEPSPCMSMQSWKFVWESCLQSVVASGLEPHMWAYVEHINSAWEDWPLDSPLICKLINGFKFHSSLLQLAGTGDMAPVKLRQRTPQAVKGEISAFLMVDAREDHTTADGLALAFLSSGQFALFTWAFQWSRFATATLFIEKTIPSLFEFVSITTGRDCRWKLADTHDGSKRLTLTASRQREKLSRLKGEFPSCEDEFPYPNLWCREKRPMIESCGHLDKLISTLKRSQSRWF